MRYLREAVGEAVLRAKPGDVIGDVNKFIENFLADKFQQHMNGDQDFDSRLQAIFEDIIGREIK